ncbi:SRPBCC family protein [Streptomyces sp. SCSIO ZS0520]|uniref:SRPBCC family protein n=1 Tax=Streptomyces sp. SCSIO ZS0520 TaxID=2892996 RepID=UPI0021D87A14|nr:SRPBCC family protein [Streptomyces sp. SCSIO ZS0520]
MPRTFTVSDSIVIALDPEEVYEQISDPRRMASWSPENQGATLGEGWGQGTRVGLRFAGHNKRGGVKWTTQCVVTAAEPGERFAFRVRAFGPRRLALPSRIASWEYRFEAVDGGTQVTETWTDDRRSWPDFLANGFDKAVTRGKVFADFQRGNIRHTLATLKRQLERGTTRGE